MKTVNLYCLLISVLCLIFIWGCGQGTELENSNDSLEVEINLAKSLSVNKQDLKLIGFKTFYVSDENERIKIKELTPIIKEKASNYYIAEDGSFFRVYFPLHTAIVKCNGKIYYADEKGVVKTDDVINLDEVDVAVIGRKRSEYVRGTGTNIIEGDKLFIVTNDSNIKMPNLVGYSRVEAENLLKLLNIDYEIEGYGYITEQSIKENEEISGKVVLKLKNKGYIESIKESENNK